MNSSSSAPAPGNSKIKLILIGAGVALLLGAILYFVGLQAGKAQLAAQKSAFDVERNGLQSKVTTAETARDAALERAAGMEARGSLYRAAIDLDSRNFGTANNHLKEASAALESVKRSDFDAVRKQIDATDLNVAVNLSGQRAGVVRLAEELEKSLPAETTLPAAPTPMAEGGAIENAPPAVP